MTKTLTTLREHFDFSPRGVIKKLIVFALVMVLLYALIYFNGIYMRPSGDDYYTPQISAYTEPVREGEVLTQTFTSPVDKLIALFINYNDDTAQQAVMYLVNLYDENGELTAQNDFNTATATSPVNIITVPLSGVKDKTFTVEISVVRTNGDSAVSFALDEGCPFAGSAQINGADAGGALALQFNTAPSGNAATYTVLFALAAIMIFILLLLSGKNTVINTLIFIVGFGFFISVLNPIGDVPDEYAHALRAQTLAQGMVFCSSTTEFDADTSLGDVLTMGDMQNNTFARFSDAHLYGIKAGEGTYVTAAGTAGNYFFLGYLASALGVKIGTALHLSAMVCVYLSRMLNVIYYAALCCAAVAIAPGFKRMFMFISCFPSSLFLASSFSPDGVTIGLGILAAALLMRLYETADGELKLRDTFLWLFIVTCMALIRMPYICLLPLIFILPKRVYKDKNQRLFVILQLAALLICAGAWSYFAGLKGLRATGGADAGAQIQYIFENFAAAVHAVIGTMQTEVYNIITGLFALGWGNYNIAWTVIFIPFMLMRLAVSEKPLRKSGEISAKPFIAVAAAVWLVTYLGMYITSNVVGGSAVIGIQGRYFIELLALAPLCLAQLAQGRPQKRYTEVIYSLFLCTVMLAAVIVQHYL